MIEFASDWNAFWTLARWYVTGLVITIAVIAWLAYKLMEWWDL